MDMKQLLDDLLVSGKQMAQKGRVLAEEKLGVPQQAGEERDAALAGLGKGAAVGGLLALMLGTRAGRKLGGTAIKLGGLAALGTIGYQAYRNWQADAGSSQDVGTPIGELSGAAAESRSLAIVRAMIAAAKADGHVDPAEVTQIKNRMLQLGVDDNMTSILADELAQPASVEQLAAAADSPAAAVEMYLASKMVVDEATPSEQQYLSALAAALELPDKVVAQVESDSRA